MIDDEQLAELTHWTSDSSQDTHSALLELQDRRKPVITKQERGDIEWLLKWLQTTDRGCVTKSAIAAIKKLLEATP